MENLIISFNSVMPMFILIAVGIIGKKANVIKESAVSSLNNMSFRIFTPILLFSNISHAPRDTEVSPGFFAFIVIAILAIYFVIFLITPRIVKDNKRRGALIQGMFRSNFVLLGLPIVMSIFSETEAALTSIAAAFVVPLFNILAVFTLETFRGGKVKWSQIFKSILKNPLIIGTVFGLVFLLTGISLPTFLDSAVLSLARCATPLALIALGASFKFSSFKENAKYSITATIVKLIVSPVIALTVAALMGYRGIEMATMMAIFAAPTAVASFAMADQMNSDAPLAAEIVVMTSGTSCITIFLWTFVLKQLNLM